MSLGVPLCLRVYLPDVAAVPHVYGRTRLTGGVTELNISGTTRYGGVTDDPTVINLSGPLSPRPVPGPWFLISVLSGVAGVVRRCRRCCGPTSFIRP